MKTSILVLAILTAACGTAPAPDEVAAPAPRDVQSFAPANVPVDEAPVTTPAIDASPRAALEYAQAVAACGAEARQLCTRTQVNAAADVGKIAYSFGNPGDYWFAKEYMGAGVGYKNNVVFTTTVAPVLKLIDETMPRQFYCCNKE